MSQSLVRETINSFVRPRKGLRQPARLPFAALYEAQEKGTRFRGTTCRLLDISELLSGDVVHIVRKFPEENCADWGIAFPR